jgi:hypothetical protein
MQDYCRVVVRLVSSCSLELAETLCAKRHHRPISQSNFKEAGLLLCKHIHNDVN